MLAGLIPTPLAGVVCDQRRRADGQAQGCHGQGYAVLVAIFFKHETGKLDGVGN